MIKIDQGIERRKIATFRQNSHDDVLVKTDMEDDLCVELPLEIRIKQEGQQIYRQLVVMMRTPGQDEQLVMGFLFTEGIISEASQVQEIQNLGDNILGVTLDRTCNIDIDNLQRHFLTSSSCGVCSKSSLDDLHPDSTFLPWTSTLKVDRDVIRKLPQVFDLRQLIFSRTGGNHATALVDPTGKLLDMSEDVGRHNAMDKIIGIAMHKNLLPLSNNMFVVSGRLSFELVQKAGMAGVPIIVALGAPSTYAIDEACAQNITIIGFAKDHSFNVYSALERIK